MPSLFAFDGKRKGFVIGGGLGFSPYVSIKDGHYNDIDMSYSSTSIAINSHFGYAWDENNQVVFEDSYAILDLEDEFGTTFSSAYAGPIWYHFFGSKGKAFYSAFGVGYYFFSENDGNYDHDQKTGVIFGAGYEFKRHFQLNLRYAYGKTDQNGWDYVHNHLNITVTGTFY